MSDLVWALISISGLIVIGALLYYVWHGGFRPNGLRGFDPKELDED